MCGILGSWLFNKPQGITTNVENGLKRLKHRGPNDEGYDIFDVNNGTLILGHTRLSIIDLSSSGHQPMHSRNGRYSIVFNGEIYNYKELKKELLDLGYQFSSDGDTEVLLIAWQHWGEECIKKLVGMFAFVVFDNHELNITCVRDAFGIKPFFYTFEEGNFFFASEISALNELKTLKPELDVQRAYDYLVHGDYDSQERTFFKNVKHLVPSTILRLDLKTGAFETKKWWKPSITERTNLSFKDAAELVRFQFLENVKLHLRSDVPVGAALSGGLDSSAIVCAIHHLDPSFPIHTFSYIAKDSQANEEKWVDLINSKVNSIEHKILVNSEDLIHDLDKMIMAQGEPFGSSSIYAQYKVFQCAKEHGITVTLEGQGADELLAGYQGYPGSRLHSLIENGSWIEAYRFLNNWSDWPGRNKSIAIKSLVSDLMPQNYQNLLRNLNNMPVVPSWLNKKVLDQIGIDCRHPKQKRILTQRGRRLTAELANALTVKGLPHLLRHGDRNSMAFSIESRVPFLTIEMADLLLSLPESYLISDEGETKHVFREAMKGIVPEEILYRKDKVGFETPELKWFIEVQDVLRNWLSEDLELPFLDSREILKSFDEIISGRQPFSWQVWRWVNFYRWYRLSF
jgi:asparagine synthase (glutamine-hydrolysing)